MNAEGRHGCRPFVLLEVAAFLPVEVTGKALHRRSCRDSQQPFSCAVTGRLFRGPRRKDKAPADNQGRGSPYGSPRGLGGSRAGRSNKITNHSLRLFRADPRCQSCGALVQSPAPNLQHYFGTLIFIAHRERKGSV